MKKNLLNLFLFILCASVFFACENQETPEPEQPEQPGETVVKELTFDEYEFCVGGEFYRVSDNGKYVVGASGLSFAAFVYLVEQDTIVCLNPEWEEASPYAHLVSATAMDVSDGGIIVGQYAFDDTYRRPAIYNINAGVWSELPLPEGTKGSITDDGSLYGEATSISADGKFISGYIISYMDNGTSRRNVVCVWKRTNDDELNPTYKLQLPIDTEADKIHCNGDWAWHISNDGKWLGGASSALVGLNVAIWENKGEGSLLERTWSIGKEDWIRTEDDNHDGIIDDEDGGDTTICQYVWTGQVQGISPSGEWIVGWHTYNGTGIIPDELAAQGVRDYPRIGFRYNTNTKVLEDSIEDGLPTVVFDDGEMIYSQNGESSIILSSSVDKKVQCGSYLIDVENLGPQNKPFIKIADK